MDFPLVKQGKKLDFLRFFYCFLFFEFTVFTVIYGQFLLLAFQDKFIRSITSLVCLFLV